MVFKFLNSSLVTSRVSGSGCDVKISSATRRALRARDGSHSDLRAWGRGCCEIVQILEPLFAEANTCTPKVPKMMAQKSLPKLPLLPYTYFRRRDAEGTSDPFFPAPLP